MTRLTVDEFMNKIENAAAWDVSVYGFLLETRLVIINGDLNVNPNNLDYSEYLGPNLSQMTFEEGSDFHRRIRNAKIKYLKIMPMINGQD